MCFHSQRIGGAAVALVALAIMLALAAPARAEKPGFFANPKLGGVGRVGATVAGDPGDIRCDPACISRQYEWTVCAGQGSAGADRPTGGLPADGQQAPGCVVREKGELTQTVPGYTVRPADSGRYIQLHVIATNNDCSDTRSDGSQECRISSGHGYSATLGPVGSPDAVAPPLTSSGPCDLPGVGFVCGLPGQIVGGVAGAAADYVMHAVTAWVTNAAVWVTGKVGELIEATTSPDVQAEWFRGQYRSMLAAAGLLALPLLLLAVIQAVIRQDAWVLARSAFAYLPLAFILAGAAIVATDLLVSITDDLSALVTSGLGDSSDNLLASVGDAYQTALGDESDGAIPLFGIFLGALILMIGAFVLWLELVIRDAAIYVALFFIPLTFVAMVWPATGRYARRLVELLIAVILAKFVIVSILALASAAITNAGVGGDDGQLFERMIAGAALLVLAAWSPFALLRLLPMMEIAAASVVTQRSSMSGAAQSAGVSSPAAYMRHAMDRSSRPSSPPAYPTTGGTTYAHARTTERSGDRTTVERPPSGPGARPRPGRPPDSAGGTVDPRMRQPSAPPPSPAEPRLPTATEAPPAPPAPPPSSPGARTPTPPSSPPAERPWPVDPPPSPPTRWQRPPEPPPDRGPPRNGGDA